MADLTLEAAYLLLYQVDSSGDAIKPPQHSRKQAKSAQKSVRMSVILDIKLCLHPTAMLLATSTAANMMKPIAVIIRHVARCIDLSLV